MPNPEAVADGVPTSQLDPYSTEFLHNPFPLHEYLRDAGPVVRLERYGICAMARHKDVHAALNDWQSFCSSAGVGISDYRKEKPWRTPSIILEVDPPIHTRTRAVLSRVLSRRTLESLRARFVRQADILVDRLVAAGNFDGMKDLAEPYPLEVFGDAIGLPREGRENLMLYGRLQLNAFGPRNEIYEEAMAQAGPIQDWVASICSRQALTADGLGAAIFTAADQGEISQDEAKLLFRAFLSAGGDTTINGIGNALYQCARNQDQWKALTEEPTLARSAFEEAIRIDPPIQTFFRTTTREIDVSGLRIAADTKVMLFLASANRDPRRWDDPDRFDIRRSTTGHVGFGAGIHGCIGQMIARMEGESILTALARKAKSITFVGEPIRRVNNTLRGWSSLPLAVQPVQN
ncbi:MAG: cytochrome P450 [Gammaproteobacteria bacterium]